VPAQVNINPPPALLPMNWERPNKPDPELAAYLKYDIGLRYADAAYWAGYSELTSKHNPKQWLYNGKGKEFAEKRGYSVDIIKTESIANTDAKIMILEDCIREAKDIPEKVTALREFREYLRFRCQVGGVPLHHTVVTGGKNAEGGDQPITIIIEQGCREEK